jgi:phage FluMu protein Com
MKYLPPKCASCEEPLFEVFENEYNTYVFDSASGTYKKHDWKGDMEIRCPNCNAKLWDIFPEGVCNYVSKSNKEKKL